jgi:hypothetical protein
LRLPSRGGAALQRITRKREVGERRQLPIFSTVAFSANALQSQAARALQRITRKREVGERRQLPIFSTVAFSANALQSRRRGRRDAMRCWARCATAPRPPPPIRSSPPARSRRSHSGSAPPANRPRRGPGRRGDGGAGWCRSGGWADRVTEAVAVAGTRCARELSIGSNACV